MHEAGFDKHLKWWFEFQNNFENKAQERGFRCQGRKLKWKDLFD